MNKGRIIVDSSSQCADLLYITGFMASDPFIYFSLGAREVVIVSALEYGRAKKEAKKGLEIYERGGFLQKYAIEESKTDTKTILKVIVKHFDIDEWEVPGYFPFEYANFLKDHGINLKYPKGTFFPQRVVKSVDEIIKLKGGLKLAENGMLRAETILRESRIESNSTLTWGGVQLTSEILRTEINIEVLRGGGNALGTIVSCGKDAADPHNPGEGPIVANKSIVIDIFPRVEKTGYWGDITRTFVKGRAFKLVKEAYNAVFKARETAKEKIRPGIVPADLQRDTINLLDGYGFKTGREGADFCGFFHGLGHGIGLEIHELPVVGLSGTVPLKEGNVITVEPGVYYPSWGGIRLEDMVLVTSTGIECLTTYPTELEIP